MVCVSAIFRCVQEKHCLTLGHGCDSVLNHLKKLNEQDKEEMEALIILVSRSSVAFPWAKKVRSLQSATFTQDFVRSFEAQGEVDQQDIEKAFSHWDARLTFPFIPEIAAVLEEADRRTGIVSSNSVRDALKLAFPQS